MGTPFFKFWKNYTTTRRKSQGLVQPRTARERGKDDGGNTLWPINRARAKPEAFAPGKRRNPGKASAIMVELGKMLWMDGKKFRVTIECDPELGLFEMKRDDFS